MPRLTPEELTNPSIDPLHYPGRILTSDALLVGSWRYPMQPQQGAPLGRYLVTRDGGPLSPDGTGGASSLDETLDRLGAATTKDRYPVVAVGSNASPGQLSHKFGDSWESSVIPATVVTVSGLGIGYSAHINRAGYMPYAPVRDNLNDHRLIALWLNAEQLQRITETEPNYYPSTLSGDEYHLVLASREPLKRFVVYRTRWGIFRATPDSPPLPTTSQQDIYNHLSQLAWFSEHFPSAKGDPIDAMATLAYCQDLRDVVRNLFSTHGHRADDGLPPVSFCPLTYGGGAGAKAWGVPGAWG